MKRKMKIKKKRKVKSKGQAAGTRTFVGRPTFREFPVKARYRNDGLATLASNTRVSAHSLSGSLTGASEHESVNPRAGKSTPSYPLQRQRVRPGDAAAVSNSRPLLAAAQRPKVIPAGKSSRPSGSRCSRAPGMCAAYSSHAHSTPAPLFHLPSSKVSARRVRPLVTPTHPAGKQRGRPKKNMAGWTMVVV
jgi:hypothetical protein